MHIRKNKNNLRFLKKYSIFILLTALLIISSPIFADARSDYDNYVATYQAYKTAVNEGKSKSEVSRLLDNYRAAKAKYESTLNIPSATQQTDPYSAPQGPTQSLSQQPSAPDIGVPQEAETEYSAVPIDGELKKLIDDLWSDKGRENPDFAMRTLNSYISKNPYSENADIARYELAKAYELLKDDEQTATKILADLSQKQGPIAQLSRERLEYYKAGVKHKEWKQAVSASYQVTKGRYENYKSASWLAFPVKITRWVGYAGKMLSFDKTKNDYEEFMIYYEEMGAKFAPPVEVTFDNFKVAYDTKEKIDSSLVVLHYDNPSSWYTRWKAISDARHSIDLQYFIMDDDIFGYSLLGLLYKKVLEGVKVRILLDARGTKRLTRKIFTQDILQEIALYQNAEIRVYNPVMDDLASVFTDVRKVVASNHDKIIVVDGEYSIIGGRNVSKDYYLDPSDHSGAYRDCDVLIKNEAVANQLIAAFDEEFDGLVTSEVKLDRINLISQDDKLSAAHDSMNSFLYGNLLAPRSTDNNRYKNFLAKFNKELGVNKKLSEYSGFHLLDDAVEAPVKIIDKNSFLGDRNDITEQVVKYIDGAKREVLIQNPYVVLSPRMFNALKRADKRGVPLIMHTNSPASTDSLLTQAMFYADWKKIFTEMPNIKIYVYTGDNKLHAKNWVFDRKIGVVGTYNLDYMSEQINSEVVAAIKSNELSRQIRTAILSDIAISAQYKYSDDPNKRNENVGPDDYPGKFFWVLKAMSKLEFLKFLI